MKKKLLGSRSLIICFIDRIIERPLYYVRFVGKDERRMEMGIKVEEREYGEEVVVVAMMVFEMVEEMANWLERE